MSHHIEAATSPFQYALTTRCGCECIAHAVQALTDADPDVTVLSMDGIGAFDLMSRASMLTALKDAPGCDRALPFVRQFYGRPSSFLWEDEDGMDHEILQGEGAEQGDPLMPALFALGQHRALVVAQVGMHPTTKLMAFHDDVYVVTNPARVADSFALLERSLWEHAGIRINMGKTQMFNWENVLPPGCQHIQHAGRQLNPPVIVWRGDSLLPPEQQGITILGTPLGHVEFVKAHLRVKAEEHEVLLNRVKVVSGLGTLSSKLQKTLSSKNTFIQKHFHPKTISSKIEDNFIHDTFIQKRVHPMTLSSKNGFVQ